MSLIYKGKYEFRGHQIEVGTAGILEKCDLRRRAAGRRGAGRKVIEIAQDVVLLEDSCLERRGNIGNVLCRFPPIDVNAARPDARVVRLTREKIVAADQIEMRTGPEPASAN